MERHQDEAAMTIAAMTDCSTVKKTEHKPMNSSRVRSKDLWMFGSLSPARRQLVKFLTSGFGNCLPQPTIILNPFPIIGRLFCSWLPLRIDMEIKSVMLIIMRQIYTSTKTHFSSCDTINPSCEFKM